MADGASPIRPAGSLPERTAHRCAPCGERGQFVRVIRAHLLEVVALPQAFERGLHPVPRVFGNEGREARKTIARLAAESWLRKFTPHRASSIWSKKNLEHVARLTKAGRMKAAGLKAVEAAKADGRAKVAYDAPGRPEVPKDFLAALAKDAKAKAFFATLNRANVYAITFRLQTAKKPETREKRMKAILERLGRERGFIERIMLAISRYS